MKWVWIILGALALVAAVIALVGAMLPVKHHATRKARFHQTPEAVYAAIAGPPDWRSDVKAWGDLPPQDGRKQWWEGDSHGGKVTFELMDDRPPSRRVVRIADKTLPFGGVWTYAISPVDGGAELRITEDGEVYNIIFRFVSRFVFGHTASIEGVLKNLGTKFGEVTRSEA